MNEFVSGTESDGVLCQPADIWPESTQLLGIHGPAHLPALDAHFDTSALHQCVQRALRLPLAERLHRGKSARQSYLHDFWTFLHTINAVAAESLRS